MPIRPTQLSVRPQILILGLAEIGMFVLAVYVAGIILYGSVALCQETVGPLAQRAMTIAAVMIISMISMGLYHFHHRMNHREIFARLFVGMAFGSAALAVIFYAVPALTLPRTHSTLAIVLAGLLVLVLRYFFNLHVDENIFRRRTLVFGCGKRAGSLQSLRRRADRRGFRIVGCVPAPGDVELTDTGWNIIEGRTLADLSSELNADEIVIAMDDRRGNLPVKDLLECRLRGIEVIDLLEFLERETGKIRVDLVNPGWLIFSSGFRVTRFRQTTKRLFDLMLSSAALLVLWPVFALVALAILIEDGFRSAVLYQQVRVGLNGEKFELLKFRSMREDAEADGQAVWAGEDDPRISRVGRVIRKYRIDELPQIINVLRGDMSWMGPRPERPEFVAELTKSIPYYAERHTVIPGITGWAQLRYPYGSSEKDAMEKLQFDLYYIKNQSTLMDLVILLQTVEVIFWGKGAR